MSSRPEPVFIPGDRTPDTGVRRTLIFVGLETHVATVWDDPADGWTGIFAAWSPREVTFHDSTRTALARKMIAHWELDKDAP